MNEKIKNALISLSDKSDIEKVLKILKKYQVNILSSGGTFEHIKKLGIIVKKYLNTQNLMKCWMEG